MANVIVYLTPYCPYCMRARQLLEQKDISFEAIRVDTDHEQRHIMENKSQQTSVPQIFIDDFHVGGYDDLAALEYQGKLDKLLGIES